MAQQPVMSNVSDDKGQESTVLLAQPSSSNRQYSTSSIRLKRLALRNFKGVREFVLNPSGDDVSVYGDNATGKTTLFDAFLWLLFDKDSANRKNFEITPLQPDGQPAHGLESEAEAELQVGGRSITFRKVYKEKWTKKRGSAQAEFTGHTTDYFVDAVPVTKADYEARVAEIASEDAFKLLTSPTYFNEQLHWQERRRILLEVCGDVSDEEVISGNKALAKLPEILQGRRLEDHRKIIAARRAEINRELERIPVRIDEVQQGLPKLEGVDPKALPEDIAKAKAQADDLRQQLAQLRSGGQVAEKTKQLREIEARMAELLRAANDARWEQTKLLRAKIQELDTPFGDLQRKLRDAQHGVADREAEIKRLEAEMARLRDEWRRVNNQVFTAPDTCPTCGQTIPESQREEALAAFNREKAEKLAEISEQGKQLKARADRLRQEATELTASQDGIRQEMVAISAKAAKLREELERLNATADVSSNAECAALQAQKDSLEREIEALRAGSSEAEAKLQQEIANWDGIVSALERAAAQVEARKRGLERIEQLKAEERQLAAEYERLEQELYLTEEFIRTKVRMLEERINSRFELARFKLFDTQVNGAVVECCETTYRGVPYSGGLNNAARINVGLDIINTLAEHYGLALPVWIDNAEAVTQLLPINGQMIRLVVSEEDKALRVEADTQASTKEVA